MIDKRFSLDLGYRAFFDEQSLGTLRTTSRNRRFYLGCGKSTDFPNYYVWELDVHDTLVFDQINFHTYAEAEQWIKDKGYL